MDLSRAEVDFTLYALGGLRSLPWSRQMTVMKCKLCHNIYLQLIFQGVVFKLG